MQVKEGRRDEEGRADARSREKGWMDRGRIGRGMDGGNKD